MCNVAKIVELIATKTVIGAGTPDDPCREITELWDFGGHLIFKFDNIDNNMLRQHLDSLFTLKEL